MNLQKILNNEIIWHYTAILLIFFFSVIGLLIYGDFGISWDEMYQRAGGIVNLKYIYEYLGINKLLSIFFANINLIPDNIPSLTDWNAEKHLQRFYSPIFDLPVTILEYFIYGSDGDEQKVYKFRHLITFVIFVIAITALYYQVKIIFNSSFLGLVSVIFLILSPRFFAESFYNCKDVMFMNFVCIGMLSLTNLNKYLSYKKLFIHSIVCAIAINMRIMGIFFIPLTLYIILVNFIKNDKKIFLNLKYFLSYLFFTSLFVYLMFPFLWESPIDNFVEVFKNMSKFPANSTSPSMLFMGEFISVIDLPWYYIPIWVIVTSPLFVIFFFFTGSLFLFKQLGINIKNIFKSNQVILNCNLALVFVPVFAIILLNSVIYNGWRHVYFIYPSIIIISIYGFNSILNLIKKNNILLKLFLSIFILFIFHQIYLIKVMHPLQNVYFNSLIGKDWKDKFDIDYWGVGNHIMIKNILSKDKRKNITICPISETPLRYSLKIINPEDKKRMSVSCDKNPDYLLNNFYQIKKNDNIDLSNYKIEDELKLLGEQIIIIYKVKE